ncbi:GNAT family N-acetyltransferase [uncultured Erythrobacter sp.]|uniref:GNAT family N-acetyltransferase n=1 Tax=uncultured Erythrobacter sp. TaxID=263913 RepID=UPI00260818DB|nr:GNAT family N-acetyltransferase [uncultured Erythrobacter sp.]
MASSPTLLRTTSSADPAQDQRDSARMASAAEARDPLFLAAWEALAEQACEPNPFFEPWFVLPSLDAFGAEAHTSLFAHYTDGALTGVLPIGRSADYYGYPVPHAASWLHDNVFCGAPLVARGAEHSFWRALLAELDRNPRISLFLHVPHLPADGPLSGALNDVLTQQSRASYIALQQNRAMLASDLSAEDYLAGSMSTKKRKELRRQHKRLSEEGTLTFERCENADSIAQWISDFLALEAKGWKGEAGSALADADATRSFFADTLTGAAQAGRLERLTMRLDGRPIAMLANFVTAPGVYSFKTTFDESYARFSPGLLIQLENLSLLDHRDIQWADSCAAEGHSMIERLWREKRTLKSHNIALGGPLRRAAFKRLMAYETRDRSRP